MTIQSHPNPQRLDEETLLVGTPQVNELTLGSSWPSGPHQVFWYLRRMTGAPVGSAMPVRFSTVTTRLKGVLKHAKLAGVMSPAPNTNIQQKFQSKTPCNKTTEMLTFSYSRHNKTQRHIIIALDARYHKITALNWNVQSSGVGTHRSSNTGRFIIRYTQFMRFTHG